MDPFQATGLLGTLNTIALMLISIRKCSRAKRKIGALVTECISSLNNVKHVAPRLSQLVQVDGIDMRKFCVLAAKIVRIEVDLVNLRAEMTRKNKIWDKISEVYLFCSATETVSALESVHSKLAAMGTEMRLLITLVESNVKNSVLLESLGSVLDAVEGMNPNAAGLRKNQRLVADARQVFETHVLTSGMNRLISRNAEGVYCLSMGRMFLEGMTVEVNYKKSAWFFKCAIDYGISEAFSYLGKQYRQGLGMKKDESKAVELFMNGAELEDPECLYAMGECFESGYGVEKNERRQFEYYTKASNVGSADGQYMVGWCLENGKGTEVDLAEAAKYYKARAEAGDDIALCDFGRCMLYGREEQQSAQHPRIAKNTTSD